MYIENENIIYLCKTFIDSNYIEQKYFNNKEEQKEYFINNSIHIVEGVTFVRGSFENEPLNHIDVELPIESLKNVNYIMYKNSNEDDYNFAFVLNKRYYNEEITRLTLREDIFQSNLFNFKLQECYVERDSIYNLNTLADNVAKGQLVNKKSVILNLRGCYLVFMSSPPVEGSLNDIRNFTLKIGKYNNPCFVAYFTEHEGEQMGKFVQYVNNKGLGDRILSCVYCPLVNGSLSSYSEFEIKELGNIKVLENIPLSELETEIELNFQVDEYSKVNTYPYSVIKVTDSQTGASLELSPEKFKNFGKAKFKIILSIEESPVYKIIPLDYENMSESFNNSLVITCNTNLPIATNLYAKYMLQNKNMNENKIFSGYLGGAIGTITSAMTGNPLGVAMGSLSLANTITSVNNNENLASMLGNSVNNCTDGAQFRCNYLNSINISLFSLDDSYYNSAISYWKKFGYPQNRLYTPSLNPSGDYKYLKNSITNLECYCSNDITDKLKEIFNRGITIRR